MGSGGQHDINADFSSLQPPNVEPDCAHISGQWAERNLSRMESNTSQKTLQEPLPLSYFLLVILLSIPFWVFGGNRLPLPVTLPASALMFVVPVLVASVLIYQRDGLNGIKALFKKAVDVKKIQNPLWYLPILLLTPLIYFLSFVFMRLTAMPLPDPIHIPWQMVPVFFAVYFISATCEQLGWMGYAIDPLQKRWGTVTAGILLGTLWQLWHLIPALQLHHPAGWIAWHSLQGVALMALIVWVYNVTGKSVLAAILVHAMDNVSWSLFPNFGSAFDPSVTGMVTIITTLIIIWAWRRNPFAHVRHATTVR